jgi:uncharacterized protein
LIYLDTSFIAPRYIQEATSEAVEVILLNLLTQELAVSHWTVVEFASLLSRRVRVGELDVTLMQTVMQSFQEDIAQSFSLITVTAVDFQLASEFLLQWQTGLRAGDALHLAIAQRARVQNLLSLDRGLIDAAQQFGIPADSGEIL